MRLALIALAVLFVSAAPALAAPSPSPSPVASHAPAKPTYDDLAKQSASIANAFNKLAKGYQQFGLSVYAAYCAKAGGVDTVALSKAFTAWPAMVKCKNSSNAVNVTGPTP